ncbi:hypothetical protein RIF25_10290 [Thermosynechococcaceae cyanobacterium BACA0444]|uniref:Uncharacterized protein n=1 Tax=Pseudocalidococcus azoricus BACA0444 TaxID=2918990 RepID=A0AAE4JYP7_9CYAN|nr:hypothetical protein [Pseudocalidococcus azoricus]MDS3861194.1 hypothetical protein [Pseudocalidococcus azoricus BACA0444]
MKFLISVPILSIALFVPGPVLATSYPPASIQKFMVDCTRRFQKQAPPGFGGRGTAFCTCMIEGIQAKMSFKQFQRLASNPNDPALKPIQRGCMFHLF